jgi:hypothetical protein
MMSASAVELAKVSALLEQFLKAMASLKLILQPALTAELATAFALFLLPIRRTNS